MPSLACACQPVARPALPLSLTSQHTHQTPSNKDRNGLAIRSSETYSVLLLNRIKQHLVHCHMFCQELARGCSQTAVHRMCKAIRAHQVATQPLPGAAASESCLHVTSTHHQSCIRL